MPIRLAILVSHPIPHFAPWHRELAKMADIDLRVYFYCDLGLKKYVDPGFNATVEWDVPLVDGYASEFLPIARRPERMGFLDVDNPSVSEALDHFQPDVLKIFGYAYRTNWRAARWARQRRRPLLLYSDSSGQNVAPWWKRSVKDVLVGKFYSYVDGALFVGDNNRRYHRRYGVTPDRLFPGVLPIDRGMLVKQVPNPPAVRVKLRHSLGIPQNAFVVLFCGKYVPRKRPMDLVRAVHELACKGLPVWALLVGEGGERLAIETLCRTQAVKNVSLTGFINQSMIPHYYAAADLLAVTSEADPHPLVVSEGACFGLPVIISDCVGCIGPNDSAQPGRNAIPYACGDVQQLASSIERLYLNRELHNGMSKESFRIAQSQDVVPAAQQLTFAVRTLYELGPRPPAAGKQLALKSEAATR